MNLWFDRTSHQLNLILPESDTPSFDLTISSIDGRVLCRDRFASEKAVIDCTGWAPGCYLVQVAFSGVITHTRIRVE